MRSNNQTFKEIVEYFNELLKDIHHIDVNITFQLEEHTINISSKKVEAIQYIPQYIPYEDYTGMNKFEIISTDDSTAI